MKNLCFGIAALALLLLAHPALAATAATTADAGTGIIGTILEVEGTGTVTPPGKAAIAAAIKTPVHMKDVIATGAKSRIFILFIDDTQITLSENSKLTVNKYVFNPDDNTNNKGDYSVLAGSFQYMSGMIAKKKNPDVTINTTFGNIGIRGTKLWAGALPKGYGVNVEEGLVQVKNQGGEVLVPKGQGTSIASATAKPAAAAPFPPETMAFIQNTVFLAGEAMLLKRIDGFQGQQELLRGQFKNFIKLPGNGLIPDGALPDGLPFAPQKDTPKKGGLNPGGLLKKLPF